MKRVIPVSVLLTLVLPVSGEAETYQAIAPSSVTVETAPSSVTVEVGPNGVVVHQRSVRYEAFSAIPDDIKVSKPFELRLATITTVSDGEADDQTSTVEVTVDALSGPAPSRIASFSDRGSEGMVSSPYFITTKRGCCSPLTRHHVRNLETGKPLFTATGVGSTGLVTLMGVPNHHPTIERWAAFEGRPEGGAMLGYLRYGDRNGARDTVALHMDIAAQPEEFIIDLPDCGALLWREPGKQPAQGHPQRPAAGECFQPQSLSYSTSLFCLEHASGPLGGFDLELSLRGKVYATIPLKDDHLDLARARLARGMSLRLVRQSP